MPTTVAESTEYAPGTTWVFDDTDDSGVPVKAKKPPVSGDSGSGSKEEDDDGFDEGAFTTGDDYKRPSK